MKTLGMWLCVVLVLAFGTAQVTAQTNDAAQLTITVLYDNVPHDPALDTDWGFSALVEYGEHIVLFDTGTSGTILLNNMAALDIDPATIEAIVLSHEHRDHVGGLLTLLATGIQPVVYGLPSFPTYLKQSAGTTGTMIEVKPGQMIVPGIFTTGELDGPVAEQALVIRTAQGLVIVTGCAHPGIDRIVTEVKDQFEEPITLVMGGFHLGDKTQTQFAAILTTFQEAGVKHVAPSHCTGTPATVFFAEAYGEDYIVSGAGKQFTFEVAPAPPK
ncbi:MAG: MBL fold metallo-hydrolase [Anaerolineae bacterium]|nr:MBL fold metallo-hydrolase [Anaerolineae bacterium]